MTDKIDSCMSCGAKIEPVEVSYCCSGLAEQCGCMGWPIDGPVLCEDCPELVLGEPLHIPASQLGLINK